MNEKHKKAISEGLKGHKISDETKRKIGIANKGVWIKFNCINCLKECEEKQSHYIRKKKHYCSMKCYAEDRKNNWKKEEQPTWKGGISPYESHRRYIKKNPERIAHLKARRYARQRNAEGSHSFKEWEELCKRFNNKCAKCLQDKKLTKDHIRPLSEGGSDYISNIQPLCRNCNSRKWKTYIYENPNLIN